MVLVVFIVFCPGGLYGLNLHTRLISMFISQYLKCKSSSLGKEKDKFVNYYMSNLPV